MIRRNALVQITLVDEHGQTLVESVLGAGRSVVRDIPCQLADVKFLKKIGGGYGCISCGLSSSSTPIVSELPTMHPESLVAVVYQCG
jgi:hypothetical protein